jgi:O-antigen/teichoic acid export membrane protein
LTPPSNSRKITENSVYLFAGQIAGLGFNLLTFILLARTLSEDVLGLFSYGLVIVGFFALLPDFGMKPILVREIARTDANRDFIDSAFTLKFCLSVIAFLGLNVYGFLAFHSADSRLILSILSFSVLLSSKSNSIRSPLECVLNARLESGPIVVSQLLDNGIQLVLVAFLIGLHAGPKILLSAYVFSNMIGFVFIWESMKKCGLVFRLRFHLDRFRWILKESLPLLLYLLLVMFMDRFDVILIRHFGGDASVGVYSGAYRLVMPLSFIPFAISYSLLPIFSAEGKHGDPFRFFEFGLDMLLWVGVFLALVSTTIGKEIFSLLFGSKFYSVAEIFQMLVIAQMASFAVFFLIDYCNSQNRQIVGLRTIALGAILSIPLQIVLIRKYGLYGAGISKNVTYGLNLLILSAMILRELPSAYSAKLKKALLVIYGFMTGMFALTRASVPWYWRVVLLVVGSGMLIRSKTFRTGMNLFKILVDHDTGRN